MILSESERRVMYPWQYCACGERKPRRCRSCYGCYAVLLRDRAVGRRTATIPSIVKIEVLVRDGPHCRHCGCRVRNRVDGNDFGSDVIEFDHFPVPVIRGGTGEASNVVVSCSRCNRSRGAR